MSDDAIQRAPAEVDDSQYERFSAPVRRLLERQGISKKEHAGTLVDILQLASSPVYRKLLGQISFNPAELIKIAEYFGESAAELFLNCVNVDRQPVPIAIPSNGQWLQGTGWIGSATRSPSAGAFVAIPRSSVSPEILTHLQIPPTARMPDSCEWLALPYSSATRSKSFVTVDMLLLEPQAPRQELARVAVLDDDKPTADGHAERFRADNIQADAFYTVASLEAVFKLYNFFLLDFAIKKTTTSVLIDQIASALPNARVVVLTGHMASDSEHREEMMRHMSNGVRFLTKPCPYDFIKSTLRVRALQAGSGAS